MIVNPKSIAVVGVARDPHKIGYIIFDNLLSSFSGKVFGVNPNAEIVLGEKIFPNILDIKGKVDLVIICVPAKIVSEVLESCGKKGIKYAIIISSGFSETGESGRKKEKELLTIAKKFKFRILGPNCLGVINNFKNLNASFATSKMPAKYKVGIFSQSGAMGAAILDFANGGGFGFSYFVSLGNKSDISEVDLLSSWANDPNVEVGVGYLEDIRDGESFIKAAKKFTAQKPLIILKGGLTKAGETAAKLHTAAMAQDEEVFKAAMKESGVILAKNISDMFELAISFAENPIPNSRRLAIISNAGGPSVVTADACDFEKIELARLSPRTVNELARNTFAASLENPIDLRGDARDIDYGLALKMTLSDENVDGVLVIISPQRMTEVNEIAWQIVSAKKDSKKPLYVNFLGGDVVNSAREICRDNGIPTFTYPERAVRAFRFQADFKESKISKSKGLKKHQKHKVAKSLINFNNKNMPYNTLSSLLKLYGVPMADTVLAKSEKEAGAALDKIKPPVVMKISSPEILHKTDVGGVMLGIENSEESKKAFNKIISNVKKHQPQAKINGVIVMETAKEGLEIIVGAKRDPVFGPVLMFGFGGILVELISDFSIALGPFNREKVRELIASTKTSKIIRGYRNGNKYNYKKLEDAVLGVGRLITEHSEILSVEINPLTLASDGKGILGLDAKIDIDKSVVE